MLRGEAGVAVAASAHQRAGASASARCSIGQTPQHGDNLLLGKSSIKIISPLHSIVAGIS